VLRVLGPSREKRQEALEDLHKVELHNLYASPNIIRVIKSGRIGWARHVAHVEEMRFAYNILVGKPEGKRPLGRPKRR
jgi:hypothetical protein